MNRILESAILMGIVDVEQIKELAKFVDENSTSEIIKFGAKEIIRMDKSYLSNLIQQKIGGQ